MKRAILITPNGFCAGVDRAILIVDRALSIYGAPVFVYHEIVHNKYVVESLIKKGVVFIDDINLADKTRPLIFSAHGVSKEVKDKAKEFKVFDATCPLVLKVHKEVNDFLMHDEQVILIGHKNHPEVIGTMGQANLTSNILLVESLEDVYNLKLDISKNISVVTQTTLSIDETKDIVDALKIKYPNIKVKNDICYATTNRQNAVKSIANLLDKMIVIGSKNSSNSNRLVETSKQYGCSNAILIDSYKEIGEIQHFKTIGVTAGASAPKILIDEVIKFLEDNDFQIENYVYKEELAEFFIPKELR